MCFEVSEGISCRAGSGNVSAVSGLSLGATELTESACFTTVSGLVVSKPSFIDTGSVISISARFSVSGSISTSCRVSISGRDSTSRIAAELRPPRTCELGTMEVVSVRLTSPARVATGVGASSRAAGTNSDSLARPVQPTLRALSDSILNYRSTTL